MDRLIEYFQQFPLFFWALAALAAAMAVLGVLLIVRAFAKRGQIGRRQKLECLLPPHPRLKLGIRKIFHSTQNGTHVKFVNFLYLHEKPDLVCDSDGAVQT